MKTKLNKTRFTKMSTVKPNFRRIRVTSETAPKDLVNYLEGNRDIIIQNLRLQIDQLDSEKDWKRKKKLVELLNTVKDARTSKDWRNTLVRAISLGYGGLVMTAVIQESLIGEGWVSGRALLTGVAIALVVMGKIVPDSAIKQTEELRGEKPLPKRKRK